MAWGKSPPALVALFDDALASLEKVERKKMFGCPAAFIDGHIFAGLFEESFGVKLSEADGAAFRAAHGAVPFEPMKGRPMGSWVGLPPAVLSDLALLSHWLNRAMAAAVARPAKPAKR